MKPNRSRNGLGSRPARVVAPTRVNGATSSGIAVAPGPLPTIDVDPEVLHGDVEQLFGRAGHAVDLVEEEDLALVERGQQRGQVAGPLDGRAAGDAQRDAELGGDDHRHRGLAEAGRPGEQDVVRRPAAAHRPLEDELELLAHPVLADELVERLGPQRVLDLPLVDRGERGHRVVLALERGQVDVGRQVVGVVGHVRLRVRRAARSRAVTSARVGRPRVPTASTAVSASRGE